MIQINPNIIALGWVSFFTDMASSMVTTLLPIYIVYVLHEGVDSLGIVIAVATFVSYAFRILFGYLSDRFHIVKPFIVTGYFISALTKPLLYFSHSYGSITFLRSLERLGKAVRSAPKDALISSYSIKNDTGRTFGFHKMMDISGELFGAIIILITFTFITQDEEMIRTVFAWTLLPGLIATIIVLFFVSDQPYHSKNKKVITGNDYHLYPTLILYFLFLFFMLSDQFLIVKVKESGYTLAELPYFIILLTLTQALTSYLAGKMIDQSTPQRMLLLSFLFGLLSTYALYINILSIAFIALALFTVISLNAMRTLISHSAEAQGSVYGILYAGIAIATALGALSIGYIWEHYGFTNVLYFSASGMATVILLFSLYQRFFKTSKTE
jgi:MFS family permease